jgi:hypothetical protein
LCEYLADLPKNFDEYKESFGGSSPEEIVQQVRINVEKFVERRIDTDPNQTLLIVGRKARLLFHPHLDRLVYKGYSPAFIRRLNGASWVTGVISNNVSLLADCINTGAEMEYVVGKLQIKGYTVDKIYCYALNKGALDNFKTNGFINDIPIIAEHTLEAGDRNFSKRVQVYYQSLVEPLDSDHAHDVYTVSTYLTQKEVQRIIEAAIKRTFGMNDLGFVDNPNNVILFLPKNVENLILELPIDKLDTNKTTLNPTAKDLLDQLRIDFPHFRLKIRHEESKTKFSIMACFPIGPLDSVVKKEDCDVCGTKQCYLNLVSSDLSLSDSVMLLCPLCMENYIERSILKQISAIAYYFLAMKAEVSLVKHDPIERWI